MKTRILLTAVSVAALLSPTAFAGTSNATTKELPDDAYVTISGMVDSVQNEREFTLRDDTGTIGVDLGTGQSVILKKGQSVTVSGTVDNDMGMVDVNASSIYVHKGLTKHVSDAAKAIPGVSTLDAQAYRIIDLPKEGMVKVSGTVSNVDNEKEFTLRDESGTVDVKVKSPENAELSEGAKVTVIGMVDSGMMGKDIDAKQVIIMSHSKSGYTE